MNVEEFAAVFNSLSKRIAALERGIQVERLDLNPNSIVLPDGPDVTAAGGGPLQIGDYGTTPSMHVDSNEIQSFDSTGTPNLLNFQVEGGDVRLGGFSPHVYFDSSNAEGKLEDQDNRQFIRTQDNFSNPHIIQGNETGGTTDGNGDLTISYGDTFAAAPYVVAIIRSSIGRYVSLNGAPGTSSFRVRVYSSDGTAVTNSNVDIHWIAFGRLT